LQFGWCIHVDAFGVEARQERLEGLSGSPRTSAAMHQARIGRDAVQPRAELRLAAK
jgi:hypothetical protein